MAGVGAKSNGEQSQRGKAPPQNAMHAGVIVGNHSMAKNGVVTGSGSASALIALVLPAAIITHTLGSLAQDVLRNQAGNATLLIDTGSGKMTLFPYTAPVQNAAFGLVEAEESKMVFTPVDATKSSTLYGLSVLSNGQSYEVPTGPEVEGSEISDFKAEFPHCAALVEAVRPSRPSYNGSSLINMIADLAKAENKQALIIVDQQSGTTRCLLADDVENDIADITESLATVAPIATFEIEYEAADTQASSSIYGV